MVAVLTGAGSTLMTSIGHHAAENALGSAPGLHLMDLAPELAVVCTGCRGLLDEAMARVRDQLHTGTDRGVILREARVDDPRWEAVPVIPPTQIELPGEASV